MVVPGLSASYAAFAASSAPLSEDAAEDRQLGGAGRRGGAGRGREARGGRLATTPPSTPRGARTTTARRHDDERPHDLDSLRAGTSTITFVALTTQTASSPTLRPSSSTASAVIRLTIRWGPAMTSTTAATRSCSMRVTIPGNRFRADWRRSAGRCLGPPLGQEAGDLPDRDDSLSARRPLHPESALPFPAPQGLDRHLEHLGRLPDAEPGRAVLCVGRHSDGVWRNFGNKERYLYVIARYRYEGCEPWWGVAEMGRCRSSTCPCRICGPTAPTSPSPATSTGSGFRPSRRLASTISRRRSRR